MAQALSSDSRGIKRICQNCGNKFYDLNQRPIKCPSCGNEFSGDIKVKTRRARAGVDDTKTPAKIAGADDNDLAPASTSEDIDSLDELEDDDNNLEEGELDLDNDTLDDEIEGNNIDTEDDDDADLDDMDDLDIDDESDDIVDDNEEEPK